MLALNELNNIKVIIKVVNLSKNSNRPWPTQGREPRLNAGPALYEPKALAQFSFRPNKTQYSKVDKNDFYVGGIMI